MFKAWIKTLASRTREKVLAANLPQVRFKARQELDRWEERRQVETEAHRKAGAKEEARQTVGSERTCPEQRGVGEIGRDSGAAVYVQAEGCCEP